MRALLHTEFAALLARAGVGQAAFARMSGYTLSIFFLARFSARTRIAIG